MASTVWDVLSAPEKRLVGRDLGSFACALALAFGSSLLGLLPDHRVQVQTWLGPFLVSSLGTRWLPLFTWGGHVPSLCPSRPGPRPPLLLLGS